MIGKKCLFASLTLVKVLPEGTDEIIWPYDQ